MVTWPTATPGTSVIALSGPGARMPIATPASRARGRSGPAAPAAVTTNAATRIADRRTGSDRGTYCLRTFAAVSTSAAGLARESGNRPDRARDAPRPKSLRRNPDRAVVADAILT